jgi:HupE / UreJ protein
MSRALAVIAALAAGSALAHGAGLGTASVSHLGDARFDVSVRLPLQAAAPRPAGGCAVERSTEQPRPEARDWRFTVRCADGAGFLALDVGAWPLVQEGGGVLAATGGRVMVPLEEAAAPPRGLSLLALGARHVWEGIDHLLFLFGLCLLAPARRWAWLVTGFTLGHSVSLALAATGLVSLATAPVEACIALSIAWAGWAAFRAGEQSRLPVAAVAAFGLVHGLGFAQGLAEAGLSGNARLWPLLGFNLGIELGQLVALVPLGAAALFAARVDLRLQRAAAFCLGAVGLAWTLARVADFWSGA